MHLPTHVTVTAPEGRLTPIHPDDGVGLGGAPLRVDSASVVRVRWTQATRRAVDRGDLVLCTAQGTPVKSLREAAAPDDLPGMRVAIRQPQEHAAPMPTPNMRVNDGGGK